MIKRYILFLIFVTLSSYGQQYDSINNITTHTKEGLEKLSISGKWEYINSLDRNEHFVTHCPIFKNNDNTILEFAKWDSNKLPLKSENNLEKMDKKFLKYQKKQKRLVLERIYNAEQQFYLYKLNIPTKKSIGYFNMYINVYYLYGVKNNYIYSIALYNYNNEIDYSNELLIKLFNEN